MQIEVKSEDCVYITINGFVYYIDDSTNEQIIDKWRDVGDVNKQSDLFLEGYTKAKKQWRISGCSSDYVSF